MLVISFSNSREIGRIGTSLNDRLGKLETRIGQLADRMERLSAQAAPARQGPDPNRVYAIKVEEAPVRGPASAPVTIAEFSDFQ